MGRRHLILWILQWIFGVYFVFVGIMHFVVPDGLPSTMEWMYELNDQTHWMAGVAEILGGLGLVLPSLTRIQPDLTVLAALGLVAVMIGALIWHATRGEGAQIAQNVIIAAVLAYIAYGRWRLEPIEPKESVGAAV